MKIVRIIARLNVGGPARHVVWLEEGLRSTGAESVLVTGVVPEGEDDMTYFARERGVVPVVIPEMSREVSPKDAVTVWKLYQLFRRERPGIVHTHTAKAGTVGRAAGFLYRWLTLGTLVGRPRAVRFVHTYHGHIFHSYYGKLKTRFFLSIEKALAWLVTDQIVVISPAQYREIHEQFGVGRSEQFRVVPLGLDLAQYDGWAERRAAARARFGATDDDVLVGIVGRLTEIKNHEMFLEAAAIYLREHAAAGSSRRVRFLVIGDGGLRIPLEARAQQLGLGPEVVTFTGTLDDPENFYPALDVVALTSLNEGTPLTLIEAMANARAVIATRVGGVIDLLGETEAQLKRHESEWRLCERGVLVERGDARAFAHGLDYLIEHQGVRAELGARGREFVAREYSLARLLADVARLYSDLCAATLGRNSAAEETSSGTRITAVPRAKAHAARLKGE